MRWSRVTIMALLAAAGGAEAQVDGQAAWLWEVSTQDGDAVVEPGETATVTMSIDMEPDVGEEMVQGYYGAVFDVLGGDNADNGEILGWEVLNGLDDLTGDTTTTDGTSLFGVTAGQLFGVDPFHPDDPIDVLSFEWQPNVLAPYEVGYSTATGFPPDHPGQIAVWVGDYDSAEAEFWPIEEAEVAFQVVPAPATALLLGACGAGLLRRRRQRRSSPHA